VTDGLKTSIIGAFATVKETEQIVVPTRGLLQASLRAATRAKAVKRFANSGVPPNWTC